MKDFFWRTYLRAMSMPEPKFITRLESHNPGPVRMPNLSQVMFLPVTIIIYAGLYVTESWDVMIGLTVLLLLAGVLLALVRNEPDDRGGWDDIEPP